MNDEADGVRLAKRVAALAGCSRREAELLIANGAVRVDGRVEGLPQARVHAHQSVEIDGAVRARPVAPVTLLAHKRAGEPCDPAVLFAPERRHGGTRAPSALPGQLAGQRCVAPLDDAAEGLVVFTQQWQVGRKLIDDAPFVEHEFSVDLAGPVAPEALQALAPARASIARQREGLTGLRLVIKGPAPGQVDALCRAAGLAPLALRRLRIGRVPLAGLDAGQWRLLRADERF